MLHRATDFIAETLTSRARHGRARIETPFRALHIARNCKYRCADQTPFSFLEVHTSNPGETWITTWSRLREPRSRKRELRHTQITARYSSVGFASYRTKGNFSPPICTCTASPSKGELIMVEDRKLYNRESSDVLRELRQSHVPVSDYSRAPVSIFAFITIFMLHIYIYTYIRTSNMYTSSVPNNVQAIYISLINDRYIR